MIVGGVLIIANNFPPVRGGSAAVYASIARHAGARIMVLAPTVNYLDGLPLIGWREHDRTTSYNVRRLPLLRTLLETRAGLLAWLLFLARDIQIRIGVASQVGRIIWRTRPAAVCLGELLASSWIIHLLAYVPRVRSVVYVHGEEITTGDHYDAGSVRRRRTLLAADRIIVVSRFTREAVLGLIGEAHAGRIALIENGVDSTRFFPIADNSDLKARYGLEGYFVFISVCRLVEKKGVDNALRAFAALLTRHPQTRFVVVGTGPYEQNLRALAGELEIAHAVLFVGEVAEYELAAHYNLGDAFVMPNRALANGDTEGFGMVFLEANACGLPVVAGRDGGTGDAVRDGENGLLVDGHSVDDITAAMLRLREDNVLRANLIQSGLAAAATADWRNKAEQFLHVCGANAGP